MKTFTKPTLTSSITLENLRILCSATVENIRRSTAIRKSNCIHKKSNSNRTPGRPPYPQLLRSLCRSDQTLHRYRVLHEQQSGSHCMHPGRLRDIDVGRAVAAPLDWTLYLLPVNEVHTNANIHNTESIKFPLQWSDGATSECVWWWKYYYFRPEVWIIYSDVVGRARISRCHKRRLKIHM